MGDFSEEEQNTIYDECMKESMTIEEIGKTSYQFKISPLNGAC